MRRIALITVLILAGELVFGLPFHTARFFRPSMLEVFGFTNTELGDLFAVYGVLAMLAYFPGGALADRFSARALLTLSLVATALGGLYMATIPGAFGMSLLYGYWGITTIFLFWGALIRATREWGGRSAQGIAFGVLEGGRGLAAAVVAAAAVAVFAALLPADASLATDEQRRFGFQSVILIYTGVTLFAALLTWFAVPYASPATRAVQGSFCGMKLVLKRPVVWVQAAVIVCAYCGYKGLDNYSLYAVQVMGMNEVEGARFFAWGAYIRPLAAVIAGLAADRFGASRSIGILFLVSAISFGALSVLAPQAQGLVLLYLNLYLSFFTVFALRGVYFVLLDENRTPIQLTGAAVGLVSLLGYTPEVFFAPIAGRILDANPGLPGFQNYFLLLAGTAVVGMVAILTLLWLHGRGKLWPVALDR